MLRRTICLDCRTLLPDGERCDLSRAHRVVPLGSAALIDEVWGPPAARGGRRPARNDHVIAAALALAPLVVGGLFLLLAVEAGPRLDWVAMAGLFPLTLMLTVPALGRGLRRMIELRSLVPRAARATAARAGVPGQVVGGELLVSPGGAACVARAVRLTFRRGVTLEDAETAGFTLRLDDGRVVEVPAGRVRLAAGASARASAIPGWTVVASLGEADDGELPRFPHDAGEELLLRPGDRVELCTPVEALPDPRARPTLYREPAATRLVAVGVPMLRLV